MLRTVDAFDGDLERDTALGRHPRRARRLVPRRPRRALARRTRGERTPAGSLEHEARRGVDDRRARRTRTYDIAANIEPEAFSTDGGALFVVQYLPPMDPDRYQVRRLDLGTGELTLVPSVDGANQGQMPGIARTSVMAPDGRRLYTLYTSEENGQRYSFVHVLDLDRQWAHCVDLPLTFGADPEAMGIAIDPNGSRVYVADVAAGKLAAIDTNRRGARHRVAHARSAACTHDRRSPPSGTQVYVAAQRNLVALARPSPAVTYFHSTLASPVRGLHARRVRQRGAASTSRSAAPSSRLDGANGQQVSAFAADTPRLTGLGFQYPPLERRHVTVRVLSRGGVPA